MKVILFVIAFATLFVIILSVKNSLELFVNRNETIENFSTNAGSFQAYSAANPLTCNRSQSTITANTKEECTAKLKLKHAENPGEYLFGSYFDVRGNKICRYGTGNTLNEAQGCGNRNTKNVSNWGGCNNSDIQCYNMILNPSSQPVVSAPPPPPPPPTPVALPPPECGAALTSKVQEETNLGNSISDGNWNCKSIIGWKGCNAAGTGSADGGQHNDWVAKCPATCKSWNKRTSGACKGTDSTKDASCSGKPWKECGPSSSPYCVWMDVACPGTTPPPPPPPPPAPVVSAPPKTENLNPTTPIEVYIQNTKDKQNPGQITITGNFTPFNRIVNTIQIKAELNNNPLSLFTLPIQKKDITSNIDTYIKSITGSADTITLNINDELGSIQNLSITLDGAILLNNNKANDGYTIKVSLYSGQDTYIL